jgi:peroxiredoxin
MLFSSLSYSQVNVGDLALKIESKDIYGKSINSNKLLAKSKILIVFYRGEWCGYCKKYAAELQDNLGNRNDIEVLLISPEQPSFAKKIDNDTLTNFHIISDQNYKIMNDYGVDYKITKESVPKFNMIVTNWTRKHNGNKDDILPVPATFLVDQSNKIIFKHFNEDYSERADLKTIIQLINGSEKN